MAFNYYRCTLQANKLQILAGEYKSMYDTLNVLANNSSAYWQGAANGAFVEKVGEMRREAISIKAEMEDLSRLILRTAREVRDEEAD